MMDGLRSQASRKARWDAIDEMRRFGFGFFSSMFALKQHIGVEEKGGGEKIGVFLFWNRVVVLQ